MSSDDEDIHMAIARSIEVSSKPHQPRATADDPIVISDDEDEDTQARFASNKFSTTSKTKIKGSVSISPTATPFLSERAQLEAARIARLQQRNISSQRPPNTSRTSSKRNQFRDPDDPFESSTSEIDEDTEDEDGDEKSSPAKKSRVSELDSKNVSKSKDKSQSLFWNGELRQTSNLHVDPRKDAKPIFSLPSILGDTSDLEFAILSSYSTPEPSWVYSFFPISVPVILVGQPSEDGTSSIKYLFLNWVRVAPFLRYGRGAMRIKLLLLCYKSGRLTIAIPTANFAEWDWKDIENSVWLQDIPKRPSPIPHDRKADDFPALLIRTSDALYISAGLETIWKDHPSIPISSIQDIQSNWDFSNVTAHLIPSLAGKHETWPSVLHIGHTRLMRVVRLIGARADPKEFPGKKKNITNEGERKLDLECQGLSIGSYTSAWIDEFYTSAKGASPEGWLNEGKTRRVKRLDALFAREGWGSWRNIKILFPTLKTVTASVLSTEHAGTMFCTRRQWDMPKFPRALFHDANSKRGKVLMHSKVCIFIYYHTLDLHIDLFNYNYNFILR
ncbi:hypothetical protein M422DRAFT_236189 [Sphaerobolus stellatus SS14]|uniref:Uncharacterized protein n=1 Tax=Sphaerobolus stellatus (strain SS14) TaxID=990650 RepID=A0A0C9UP63_SPHS4|nr:hypothetical protein M422DRAFT_236189 [Sphaerobolus stellatus SS14]